MTAERNAIITGSLFFRSFLFNSVKFRLFRNILLHNLITEAPHVKHFFPFILSKMDFSFKMALRCFLLKIQRIFESATNWIDYGIYSNNNDAIQVDLTRNILKNYGITNYNAFSIIESYFDNHSLPPTGFITIRY